MTTLSARRGNATGMPSVAIAGFPPGRDRAAGGRTSLTSSRGLAAATAEELGVPFLKMPAPDDAIGRDGKKHEAGCGA